MDKSNGINNMNILVDVFLPHTKEHYEITPEYLVCPTGETYEIYDLDKDLLDDWMNEDVDFDVLLFTIKVDAKLYEYEYKGRGEINNGEHWGTEKRCS